MAVGKTGCQYTVAHRAPANKRITDMVRHSKSDRHSKRGQTTSAVLQVYGDLGSRHIAVLTEKFDLSLLLTTLMMVVSRDVVLTKKVWERIQKTAILKELQSHFKGKRKKGWERRSHTK